MAGCPVGPVAKAWSAKLDELGFPEGAKPGVDRGKRRNVVARVPEVNRF